MQDEVSETENIRKNLSIERMIVEGCDILLDVNQTFVRQGIQYTGWPNKNVAASDLCPTCSKSTRIKIKLQFVKYLCKLAKSNPSFITMMDKFVRHLDSCLNAWNGLSTVFQFVKII